MLLRIRDLANRLVERLREAIQSLPMSGPWPPKPVPVPIRPEKSKQRDHWPSRFGAATLAFVLAVAGTTAGGRADDTAEMPCRVCRVWDTSMREVPQEQMVFEAHAVENGVVLRATSTTPEVRSALWEMTSQRQQVLEGLQQGQTIPLCPTCQANLRAFDDLRIDTVHLPDGVLLLYTSAQPEIVRRLHEMLTGMGMFL